jgi:hypothetical protein
MSRPSARLLLTLLVAACGGGSDAPADRAPASGAATTTSSKQGDELDACTLLTADEIRAAAGWAPDTMIGKTHGTTKTCAIHGADALKQSIVLIVARPAPKVSSSAELAERRTRDAARSPEIKIKYTPVDGLGMPAVRTEVEGSRSATLETVVGNRVLSVSTAGFDAAKSLAQKAADRLRP